MDPYKDADLDQVIQNMYDAVDFPDFNLEAWLAEPSAESVAGDAQWHIPVLADDCSWPDGSELPMLPPSRDSTIESLGCGASPDPLSEPRLTSDTVATTSKFPQSSPGEMEGKSEVEQLMARVQQLELEYDPTHSLMDGADPLDAHTRRCTPRNFLIGVTNLLTGLGNSPDRESI